MDDIGRTAGQVNPMYKCRDCRAFQRDVNYLEHLLRKERARGRQTREWRLTLCQALDEAHEKLAELQPREESYCDTEEEIWQNEDWEKEADVDEDTQQPEDCEVDSETLSSTKVLTEITKQNQELQFERSTNKALLDELETLRASNNELIQKYEADTLRAEQQASHLKAELEKAHKSQIQSFQAEQNLLRLQMMEEMRCLRKSAAEEKMLLQREVEELTSQLSMKKEREDETREWRLTLCQALDEAHEKLAELQPREESYCDTEEEIWQNEDWEKEADVDEDTQQPEDCEVDSETLSSTKVLTEITKQNQELQFERSTNKALLDELETLRASNNELIQKYEADTLRAEQQASHLKAELEKAHKSQIQSFQAEQNLLRLQMMEEMRCLCKSAAEEKMLLQREVEELTSQLSMKKEREDDKNQEWQEDKDEEKQEEKVGEEQQEKEEEKWGEEAGGGEPVDKTSDETVLSNQQDSLSDALPASEPVVTESSEETPKKKKSSIWKRIKQCLGLRRRKKQKDTAPHN